MVHRLGRLEISETSVAVVVTAPHRKPAFDAALEGINRLKKAGPGLEERILRRRRSVGGRRMGRLRGQSSIMRLARFCCATGAASGSRRRTPNFKIDVQLVRLLVTVKNAAGDLVGSLDKRDFTVFDNGVKQEIAVFEHQTTQPLSVSLLIDTSGSTAKDLRYETVSLAKFLNALVKEGNPDDAASLYSFNDQVTLAQFVYAAAEAARRQLAAA